MTDVIKIGRAAEGGQDAGNMDHGLQGIGALGVDEKDLFCLSAETHQVIRLSVAELSEATLQTLQSLEKWQKGFPRIKKTEQFDLSRARAALIAACQEAGIFDPRRVRGRGVWLAGTGETVVHRGDYVYVNGRAYRPNDQPLKEIYPGRARLGELQGDVLPEGQGQLVMDALSYSSWADPVHARMLAGWIVTAPVCACLHWRSHLWLTGPAASGKSWLLQNVVLPLLGHVALAVEGGTTAAGIRQELGPDARPCAFDEAEAHKASGLARIEGIMEMGRYMSSEFAAQVLKGGSGHKALSFTGITQFLLASIGVPLSRTADMTRWTVLDLRPREPAHDEERLAQAETLSAIGGTFPRDLLTTTIAHLPTLRQNHERYAQAIERRTGIRRLGDQIGGPLAGERLLRTYAPISAEEADADVAALPMEMLTGQALETDEARLWNMIFSFQVTGETHSGRRPVKRTLGQIVQIAMGLSSRPIDEDGISEREAQNTLIQIGMQVRPDPAPPADDPYRRALFVMNNHPRINDLLRGTDYPEGWHRVLQRIPSVTAWPTTVRLPGMMSVRGLKVPLELFKEEKV